MANDVEFRAILRDQQYRRTIRSLQQETRSLGTTLNTALAGGAAGGGATAATALLASSTALAASFNQAAEAATRLRNTSTTVGRGIRQTTQQSGRMADNFRNAAREATTLGVRIRGANSQLAGSNANLAFAGALIGSAIGQILRFGTAVIATVTGWTAVRNIIRRTAYNIRIMNEDLRIMIASFRRVPRGEIVWSSIRAQTSLVAGSLGRIVATLGLVVAGFTAAASAALLLGGLPAFARLEGQLARVAAATGSTLRQIQTQYQQLILNISRQTGQLTEDISTGVLRALSGGLTDQTQIGRLVQQAAQFQRAGLGTIEDAVSATTTIFQAFRREGVNNVDIINRIARASQIGEGDARAYANAFRSTAALAAEAGLGLDEFAASLATIAQTAPSVSQGATQLQGVLRLFLNPSQQAQRALRDLGLPLQELRRIVREEGLAEALEQLRERIRLLAGRGQLLQGRLFPREALVGFLSIDPAALRTATNQIAESGNDVINNAADQMEQTINDRFARLGRIWSTRLAEIGEAAGIPVRGVIDGIIIASDEALSFFANMVRRMAGLEDEFAAAARLAEEAADRLNRRLGAEFGRGFLPPVAPQTEYVRLLQDEFDLINQINDRSLTERQRLELELARVNAAIQSLDEGREAGFLVDAEEYNNALQARANILREIAGLEGEQADFASQRLAAYRRFLELLGEEEAFLANYLDTIRRTANALAIAQATPTAAPDTLAFLQQRIRQLRIEERAAIEDARVQYEGNATAIANAIQTIQINYSNTIQQMIQEQQATISFFAENLRSEVLGLVDSIAASFQRFRDNMQGWINLLLSDIPRIIEQVIRLREATELLQAAGGGTSGPGFFSRLANIFRFTQAPAPVITSQPVTQTRQQLTSVAGGAGGVTVNLPALDISGDVQAQILGNVPVLTGAIQQELAGQRQTAGTT